MILIGSEEEEDILMREADLQRERERYPSRDRDRRPPRRRGLPSNGRPPDRSPREPSGGEGPPDRGGPPDDGGPLVMEDHPVEMEDPQDVPIEEELQDQEDPLDQ